MSGVTLVSQNYSPICSLERIENPSKKQKTSFSFIPPIPPYKPPIYSSQTPMRTSSLTPLPDWVAQLKPQKNIVSKSSSKFFIDYISNKEYETCEDASLAKYKNINVKTMGLDLTSCTRISDEGIKHLQALPVIFLKLRCNKNITEKVLREVIPRLPLEAFYLLDTEQHLGHSVGIKLCSDLNNEMPTHPRCIYDTSGKRKLELEEKM